MCMMYSLYRYSLYGGWDRDPYYPVRVERIAYS